MSIENQLVKLARNNPDLEPHVRRVLAEVNKTASQDSLKAMQSKFVSKVLQELDDAMRGSPVDSTAVKIDSYISVVNRVATLIYSHPSLQYAQELRFSLRDGPKKVAKALKSQLEELI